MPQQARRLSEVSRLANSSLQFMICNLQDLTVAQPWKYLFFLDNFGVPLVCEWSFDNHEKGKGVVAALKSLGECLGPKKVVDSCLLLRRIRAV